MGDWKFVNRENRRWERGNGLYRARIAGQTLQSGTSALLDLGVATVTINISLWSLSMG